MSEKNKTNQVSRRDFLRMSALAAAGATVVAQIPVAASAADSAPLLRRNQQTQPITLKVVSGQDVTEIDVRKQVAQLYSQVNPNVTIQILLINGSRPDSQTTMMAGGNPPDILYLNEWFQYPFFQKGVALALDDYVKRDNVTFAGILPEAVDINRYKGKLYATPFEVATLAIVYNKKLFDDAKVAYPPVSWDDPNWTWEAMIEMATKLTNADQKQFGLSIENWMYWSFLYQYGAEVVNNTKEITASTKCDIDSPQAAQAFQLQTDLYTKYNVSPSSASSQQLGGFDRFMSGKVAMYAYGRWLDTFRTIKDFDWDVAPLPHVKGNKPATQLFTLNYAIYVNSTVADTAWDFLKFLMTEKPQDADVASGMAVAVLDSVNQSDVYLKSSPPDHNNAYSDGLAYARPQDSLDGDFSTTLQPFLDKIQLGTTTDIAGTLSDAAAAVNKGIDDWRKQNLT
jgi:multiple sugar transport system substrate-binding protein